MADSTARIRAAAETAWAASSVPPTMDDFLAAVIRAVANEVVPAPPLMDSCCEYKQIEIRRRLLAIAQKLQPPTAESLAARHPDSTAPDQ